MRPPLSPNRHPSFGGVCPTTPLGFKLLVSCLIVYALVSTDSPWSTSPTDLLVASMAADSFIHFPFQTEVVQHVSVCTRLWQRQAMLVKY